MKDPCKEKKKKRENIFLKRHKKYPFKMKFPKKRSNKTSKQLINEQLSIMIVNLKGCLKSTRNIISIFQGIFMNKQATPF